MEIKPKHFWIAGITLWLLAIGSAKIWPPKQSFMEFQYEYNMQLMLMYSDVHRAELIEK